MKVSVLFSEPKIPQFWNAAWEAIKGVGFSALQRAENSSILSAALAPSAQTACFSALQRAENSSIFSILAYVFGALAWVSVLFSEPKIPQLVTLIAAGCPTIPRFQCSSASRKFLNLCTARCPRHADRRVSVLFSEPKIPQFDDGVGESDGVAVFQCSSASRKFLNPTGRVRPATSSGFSALQRAENSSI